MVYSWHGIAHTSRVLFMSYLIANTIPDIPTDVKEGCYYAAIIHDLGKKSDREGEEHGNSSAMLYDSRLKSMISNSRICNSVLEAIRYHSVDDSLCPVTCKNNLIWKILKDADALDRSRFHGKGCDKSYLRLSIYDTLRGQKILALANVLPSLTEYNSWNSPYEEIVKSIKQYK
jgi:HD superfamily phosphodiesterase